MRPEARLGRDAPLLDGAPQTFWGLLAWRAATSPDALCMVDEVGRRMSFGEYHARSEVVAAGLLAAGVAPGATVAWQLPTRIESLVVCAALSRLGVVQVPVVPIYRARELGHALAATTPSHLLVPTRWRGREHAVEARELAADHGCAVLVVDDDLPTGDPADLPAPPSDPDAHRWTYFTSGTTGGVPKGARHSDGSLVWAAHAEVECLDLWPDDRTTIVFPVAHIGGAFFFMAGLIAGQGQILIAHFGDDSVEVLRREGVSHAGAGLSFQRAYLEAQRRDPTTPLFPRIRSFPHGGDAKRPHVHEALVREFGGVGVLSGYGMTEFAMVASGAADDPPAKLLDRLGRPCTGIDVRIVGADEQVCPPGVEGEIRAKGRSMCLGYLDPAHDEAGFDADGYFRTGDVGFVDEDGFLELTGRLKDVIIRKGENISAVEVEDLLHRHPAVAEVAVVGVPDAERGEMCCAVVVPAAGRPAPGLAELNAFLVEQGLMTQKLPERLELRDELPRDFFAKVNKAQLRRELLGSTQPIAWLGGDQR